jgi:hypothetical protein
MSASDARTEVATRPLVRDGLSQQKRFPSALTPGYFEVCEQRFEHLMVQLQAYGKLVAMPNVPLEPGLFADNELMVIAHILALDSAQLEQRFNDRLDQTFPDRRWVLNDTGDPASIGGLKQLLVLWQEFLRRPQSGVGEALFGLITDVRRSLEEQMSNGDITQSVRQSPLGEDEGYRTLFAALLKALDMIQERARAQLQISFRCGNHDPAFALRAAFVRLLERLQQRINRFTSDLVDFYYRDILRMSPRPALPDAVHLILQSNLRGQEIHVPKDTEFFAGLDPAGQSLIYASDQDLVVDDAQVGQVFSLYFPRPDGNLAMGCWCHSFEWENAADATAAPIFGAARNSRGQADFDCDSASIQSARLGFAVASQVLLLREGQRKIRVDLVLNTGLVDLLRQLPELKNARDQNTKFFAYFGQFFSFSLSASDGWYSIDEYKPDYRIADVSSVYDVLQFDLELPDDCPAIVPFDPAIHGDGLTTALPVLRVLLRENHLQYPYDLLRPLILREVRIQVDVRGCSQLQLYNNIGPLSPLLPFTPFGPMPEVGDFLVVGNEETCGKQLSHVSVDIEWGGLPRVAGGFQRWYEGYAQERLNSEFAVSTSVLVNGQWQPETGRASGERQPLFADHLEHADLYLLPRNRLSVDPVIRYHQPRHPRDLKKQPGDSVSRRNGFFKFTLEGPEGAFGHREYPFLLSEVLTENAKTPVKKLTRPIPNPPYTPEIRALRFNYRAEATVKLTSVADEPNSLYDAKFFHVRPLGWEAISPLRHRQTYLLPQFTEGGNLYIGIRGSSPQLLSLLFRLRNNSLPIEVPHECNPGARPSASSLLSWAYMRDNQWRPLGTEAIKSDSTEGFMTTGIVQLELPQDADAHNTVMPGGLYWLRVSANDSLHCFSDLYSIHTQALRASWRSGDHVAGQGQSQLPAGSIQRAAQSLPGLTAVFQLDPSFGGRRQENERQLRQRTSERLRHKQRALLPGDYEALILERFPELYKVKCFPNVCTLGAPFLRPGHVLIIPIPKLDMGKPELQPHCNGHLIAAIREFIEPLTPAHARVAVENPHYEQIQVRCTVTFASGQNLGQAKNRLLKDLSDFLSPWHEDVGNTKHFGWRIGTQELKAFLHHRDYIDSVSGFSLLRIAPRDDNRFTLDDTAADADADAHAITPSVPWSTAIPLPNHVIRLLNEAAPDTSQRAAIEGMEIGSTLIIT